MVLPEIPVLRISRLYVGYLPKRELATKLT